MTSLDPRPPPRSRILIPLIVAVLGVALGAGGIALLRPFGSDTAQRLAAAADKRPAKTPPGPLSATAIRARIEPSVVDVTATLTYDDETASGTGFVVDARSGFILTNNHVIRDATSIIVTAPATGQTFPASIVGVSVPADIAVLSIRPSAGLPSAPLDNSAAVAVGSPVLSFGNQAGAGGSPTVAPGVITGTDRTIQADDGAAGFSETLHGMLATTAPIEPGDSGGPLAGPAGTVIGVDTAAGTGGPATGYAIPISTAMAAERQITARHRGPGISIGVSGFLGVMVGSSSAHSPVAQQKQERSIRTGSAISSAPTRCVTTQADATTPAAVAPARAGALVVGVLCGTGAATAGIAPGDVITTVNGHQIDSASALTGLVNRYRPGRVLRVTWITTSGGTRTASIALTPAPAA
ncbi:MAG TPA: trypsin-like peptidase domain-containing protein [Trebonia sp.]|nr:trypsin-like peptidase domain-containing protein [Trebonia sp.]